MADEHGELGALLKTAHGLIERWCDPRRLHHTDERELVADSLGFLGRVHICCQCGGVGKVRNRHFTGNPELSDPFVPISWVCAGCRRHVCINCVLTIPGSVPTEIGDDTLCSTECEDKLAEKRRRGEWA